MAELMMEDQIAENKRLSVYLCIFMFLLLAGLILSIAVLFGIPPIIAFMIGIPVALIYVFMAYSFSVENVIRAAQARPANPNIREEQILIYKVEEMAIAAGLPTPKVYVQDSSDINAFATGRKPEEAVICATTGCLKR